jgi:predicted transcriptional regulator
MTYNELITKVKEYQYLEDDKVIKVALAGIVSTRLRLSPPIWYIIIGASSGGKSQILRPLSITDPKFLHRVDDLTENTFLSGMKARKGEKEPSLLRRIGTHGMMVISDLTVLFSKAKESRGSILAQLRMVYDGEMNKFSGTSNEPLHWHGDVGIIAGSTPSIYAHFEEVADMGERFIYYRMKDFDDEKATRLALSRKINGRELDEKLAELYAEYIKKVVKSVTDRDSVILPEEVTNRIIKVSSFAERIRTPAHLDWREKTIDKIPVRAKPVRVALQLDGLAKGLLVMSGELSEDDIQAIEWCGYSLANEEKRAILKILAGIDEDADMSTQKIADLIGLSTSITGTILQNLASINVIKRSGRGEGLYWSIKDKNDRETVRRLEGITENRQHADRELSQEEIDDSEDLANNALDNWGK